MAIIYTYPQISTLSLSDSVLVTDNDTVDPAKRTKQATVQQLKTLIAGSPLSLTTQGSSGEATLSSNNVLNVPNYSGGGGTVGPGTISTIPIFSSSTTIGDSIITQHSGNDGSNFNDTYFQIAGTGGMWMGNIRLGSVGGVAGGDGYLMDSTGVKGSDGQVLTSTGFQSKWEDIPNTDLQIGTFANKTTTLNSDSSISFTSTDSGTTVSIASALSLGGITAKNVPYVTSGGEFSDSNLEFTDSTIMTFSENVGISNGKLSIATGDRKLTLTGPSGTSDYELKLPAAPAGSNRVLTVTGNGPYESSWQEPATGTVTGGGTTDTLAIWKTGTELTNSVISQDANDDITIGGAKLVITPYVFGGLKIKDDGSKVTLSGPAATGNDYGLKLPAKPTAGGQVLAAPATLGSSPYQLEWTNLVDTGHTTASITSTDQNIINNTTYNREAILVQDVWTGGSYTPLSMSAYTPGNYDTTSPGKTGFAIYKGKITDANNAIAVSGAYLAERVAVGCNDIAFTADNSSSPQILSPGDFFVFVMFLEGDGSSTASWGGVTATADTNICAKSAEFGVGFDWPESGTFPTLSNIIAQGTVATARVCPIATFQKS